MASSETTPRATAIADPPSGPTRTSGVPTAVVTPPADTVNAPAQTHLSTSLASWCFGSLPLSVARHDVNRLTRRCISRNSRPSVRRATLMRVSHTAFDGGMNRSLGASIGAKQPQPTFRSSSTRRIGSVCIRISPSGTAVFEDQTPNKWLYCPSVRIKCEWDRRDSNTGPTDPIRRGYHYPTVPCISTDGVPAFNLFVSGRGYTRTRSSSTATPLSASGLPARWPRHTAASSGV